MGITLQKETNLYDTDAIADGISAAITTYDNYFDQTKVFNRLTNNGSAQGIFMVNGQLYINMSYLQTGMLTLGGANNISGLLVVNDASGNEIGRWDKDGAVITGNVRMKSTVQETFNGTDVMYVDATLGMSAISADGFFTRRYDSSGNVTSQTTFGVYSRSGTGRYSESHVTKNNAYSRNVLVGVTYTTLDVERSIVSGMTTFEEVVYNDSYRINFTPGTGYGSSGYLQFDSDKYWKISGATSGNIAVQGSSSMRYKHDVSDKLDDELDPHRLYNLPVKQFVFNEDHELQYHDMRDKTLPGFIAEDVECYYPSATIHDGNGNVENWDERRIIPGMLKLIQEQHEEIERLKQVIHVA